MEPEVVVDDLIVVGRRGGGDFIGSTRRYRLWYEGINIKGA